MSNCGKFVQAKSNSALCKTSGGYCGAQWQEYCQVSGGYRPYPIWEAPRLRLLLSSGQLFLILHLCGRVQQPYSSCVSWYIVPASHRPTLCFSAPIQISRRGSLIRSAWARNLPMVWSSSCCWLMILSWWNIPKVFALISALLFRVSAMILKISVHERVY